jgi:hypothetical protein
MKRQLTIHVLIVIYLICSARSCNDSETSGIRDEHKIVMVRDSVKEAFETGYLSDEALHEANLTAKQKLLDMTDYLHILNDTNIDRVIRKKASGMIRSLFLSEDVKLKLNPILKEEVIPLKNLLSDGLSGKYAMTDISIDSVMTVLPLRKINDTLYAGKLHFIYRVIGKSDALKQSGSTGRTLEISSVRGKKTFGSDTIRVWSVSLGNME